MVREKELTHACRLLASSGLPDLLNMVAQVACTDTISAIPLIKAACFVIGDADFEPNVLSQCATEVTSMALRLFEPCQSSNGNMRVVPDEELLAATSALGAVVGHLEGQDIFNKGVQKIFLVGKYASEHTYC